MQLAKWSEANVSACGVGGLEGGMVSAATGEWVVADEDQESGHVARSTFGVRLYDVARIAMNASRVEFTGLRAAAILVDDGCCAEVDACEIVANSVGIMVQRDARVLVTNSQFAENDMAAFLAGTGCEGASVTVRNTSVAHKVWFNRQRPGALSEEAYLTGLGEAGSSWNGVCHNESRCGRIGCEAALLVPTPESTSPASFNPEP